MKSAEIIRNWKRTLAVTFFLVFSAISAFADEVIIPFPVYLEDFKNDAKSHGLDLEGQKESIGFVQDRGSDFSIFTYKHISIEHLEVIQSLSAKHLRK